MGELRQALQHAQVPAIVLMFDDMVSREGHFRVAVGSDDDGIIFHDPWDRDAWPEVVHYNDTYFCSLWSHAEQNNNVTYDPYFAAMLMPWHVDLEYDSGERNTTLIIASVSYPCVAPFCQPGQYPAEDAAVKLSSIPPHWTLLDDPVAPLGTLQAGSSVTATWRAIIVDTVSKSGGPHLLTARATGAVTGSVPAVPASRSTFYPKYEYKDIIGGTASISI